MATPAAGPAASPVLLLSGACPAPTVDELRGALSAVLPHPFVLLHYRPPAAGHSDFRATLKFECPGVAAEVLAAAQSGALALGSRTLRAPAPKAHAKRPRRQDGVPKKQRGGAGVGDPPKVSSPPLWDLPTLLASRPTRLDLRRAAEAAGSIVGLAALAAAMEGGALPELTSLRLPAAAQQQAEASDVLERLAGLVAVRALRRTGGPGEALRSLSRRGLGDGGAACVAEELRSGAIELRSLGLQHNGIGERGAAALADALADNTSLTELALFCNNPGGFWGPALAAALRSNTTLTSLDLGGLRLGDEGTAALAEALTGPDGNTTVRDLHLDFCDVGVVGGAALVRMAKAHTALVNLWLHGNPLIPPEHETAAAAAVEANAAAAARSGSSGSSVGSTGPSHLSLPAEGRRRSLVAKRGAAARDALCAGETARTAAGDGAGLVGGVVAVAAEEECKQARKEEGAGPDTTTFADRVAQLALRAYHQHCAEHARNARGQTVVAAFVLSTATRGEDDEDGDQGSAVAGSSRTDADGSQTPAPASSDQPFSVVALGVGTKFLAPAVACSAAGARGELVRDSHAEVLAHRSLRRFFLGQAALVLEGGFSTVLRRADPPARLALRDGVTLILYTSTAPCGAASATGRGDGVYAKGNGGKSNGKSSQGANTAGGCERVASAFEVVGARGRRLSCSDKLARWVRRGLLGRQLRGALEAPVRLTAVVVGRKHAAGRCERAICGPPPLPLPPLPPPPPPAAQAVAAAAGGGGEGWSPTTVALPRPVVLSSTVRVEAPGGAGMLLCGDTDECWSWALGDDAAERHDGRTGRPLNAEWGALSSVCSRAIGEEASEVFRAQE